MFWRAILVSLLAIPIALTAGIDDRVVGAIQDALRSKNYQQALELSRQALRSSPANVQIGTMKAMALSGLGRKQDALAAYTKVLIGSPQYLPALEGAAEIEYQQGNSRASTHLNEILKQRPHDPTAHAMLAVLAYKKRDYKDAVANFRESSAVLPSQPKAMAEYGACLVQVNQPAEAVPVFAGLLELQPDNQGVRYDLALAHFLAGDAQSATATLQPLLGVKSPDPDVLDLASSAYESQGLTPRATDLLHRAIVLAPKNANYYVHFASLCLSHSSYQVGVEMLTAGIAYLPQSAALYLARGILYIQGGQYDEGEADFETADRLDPQQAFSSEAIGITELQKSNLDKALRTVRARLHNHPGDAFLHYLLAEILTQKGAQAGSPEFKEAVAEALRATQLKPNFTPARDMLGGLYLKSAQIQEAIYQSREALSVDSSDQEALYHLIQGLRKQGKASQTTDLLKHLASLRAAARNTEALQNRYKLVDLDPDQSGAASQ